MPTCYARDGENRALILGSQGRVRAQPSSGSQILSLLVELPEGSALPQHGLWPP